MRLIDEEHFIENIKLYLNRSSLGEITSQTEISVGELASLLEDEPMAYDIDKVVEELEEKKQNALEVEESIKEYNVWNDAIKIINQGGMDND